MYQKDSKLRNGPSLMTIGLVTCVVLLLILGVVYFFNRPSSDTSSVIVPDSSSAQQAGTIAVLGQAEVNRTAETSAEANQQQTQEEAVSSYTFSLPAGWSAPESVDEKSTCSEDSIRKTTTKSGSITVTFYENGRPNSCDQTIIGDSALTYSINEINAFVVEGKEQLGFCTKEQNPACPRGDGKLTLHLAKADTATTVRNDLYVVMEDTGIQPDLNAHALKLIAQLEQMLLN